MQAAIDRDPMPAVWLNRLQPENAVHPDDRAGAHAATAHLLGLGHTRIAFLQAVSSAHYSTGERLAGYQDAMAAAGKVPSIVGVEGPELDWCAQVQTWLSQSQCPTAVIAAAPQEAQTLIMACAHVGIRIPEQLSIVAISESEFTHLGVDLTRIVVPFHDLGVHAVRMLLTRIGNPREFIPALALPMPLLERASTARL
jgi:LacI family transcriptional regulator